MKQTAPSSANEALDGSDDRLWQAVVDRDKTYDGYFYYSVETTGVYCRPSCASRQARRENVRFHATSSDAEAAGFRPCKRCKPDEASLDKTYAAKVAAACRLIEQAEEPPSLDALAKAAGLSPHHFHRIFKAVAGVTPKAYATAHRRNSVQKILRESSTVTEAIHAAGFNSSGRFYAGTDDTLGMTPTDFRAGGKETEIRFALAKCALGTVLVAATSRGIAAITLGDDAEALLRDLDQRFPKATLVAADPGFEDTITKVIAFMDTPSAALVLPLDVQGTAFQHRVWDALRQIPPGTTITYSQLAERIGKPAAIRAVASACAANPVAIAIPCHRVVHKDGNLAGYRWGIERKRALLDREQKK